VYAATALSQDRHPTEVAKFPGRLLDKLAHYLTTPWLQYPNLLCSLLHVMWVIGFYPVKEAIATRLRAFGGPCIDQSRIARSHVNKPNHRRRSSRNVNFSIPQRCFRFVQKMSKMGRNCHTRERNDQSITLNRLTIAVPREDSRYLPRGRMRTLRPLINKLSCNVSMTV
jgi:hypothetical protein